MLDVIIRKGAVGLKMLTSGAQSLLFRWDAFLGLDQSLDVVNGFVCLEVRGNDFACLCFDEDLHLLVATTTHTII